MPPLNGVGVEGRHDIRMDQRRDSAHFAQKHFLAALGVYQAGGQHFQRYYAAHGAVFSFEHLSHAPATDLIENLVLSEDISRGTARQQSFSLKLREYALLHQQASGYPTAIGLRNDALSLGELLIGKQTALAHGCQ